ncbi:PAS domain S-box protein [uncultured Mucilaginibacter sp.]|uniref:PAS domain S-box protein n=1 Tax=uncultured Mucilaginibacter sp. TaxID=797541 RepID=UPI0025ECB4A0|nr:PAS domain S-box protein [uncultured Mucilaginibacter sp.]
MVKKVPEGGYQDIFNYSPATILVMDVDAPFYTILDVNEAYLNATNSTREELVGKSVFGAFPANPTDEVSQNIERTIFSFEQAIQTKKSHTMYNYRYDIPVRGTAQFEERWWTTTNTPILDERGEVVYFIHSPANVTELIKLGEREKAGVEALKNQRKQLYSTFMQAPVGIAIFKGPDYVVELINPPLGELYGQTPDGMMGKPVFEVLTHAKGLGFEELLDDVRLTGKPFRGHGLSAPIYRNGKLETVYLDFVYEPFREDDGAISGVIAIATEVTEQVYARQQLEEAEERARLAVDAVGLGTFDLSLLTGEMITSKQFANIFGYDEPVSRHGYVKVFHPADLESRKKAHEAALKTGRLLYEARVLWPDKSTHWVRVEGKVYYDTGGKAIRILGTLLDITGQKKAKEALAESEQLLRSITSAAPTTLWMTDEYGLITYVNQTWVDWTGMPIEAHIGTKWTGHIIEEDKENATEKFENALLNRSMYEVEFRINHIDGTTHWCVANGRPQYRRDGRFSGYIGACVDITEQKYMQQQKDDFIGIASHELKTPVTSLKAYTQVLERMLQKKGDIREAEMIGRMDGQLNRLTSLIGDLLDVTKFNSGKLQFNNQEYDFNTILDELLEDLQRTTTKHTIVKKLVPAGLIHGDKERIGQVITNLVTNAIKYSPHSDKIIVYTNIDSDEITLCVQDFGIGIAKKNLNMVFEQFYRVSGEMQHTFPGLGLGLNISSEIIKREGGRIWVTSEEGKGSTFCFALPIANRNK